MSAAKAKQTEAKAESQGSRKSFPRRGCRNATTRRSCPGWPRSSAAPTGMSLPRLQKIVVNMGVGKAITEKKYMEEAVEAMKQIAGQKP